MQATLTNPTPLGSRWVTVPAELKLFVDIDRYTTAVFYSGKSILLSSLCA